MKNKIIGLILFSFVAINIFLNSNIFAVDKTTTVGTGFNPGVIDTNQKNPLDYNQDIKGVVNRITSTVITVLQILAVAGVVICGVKYMITSADQKADIKKSMISVVIGCVIVFATSTVVQFIINAFDQTIK